MVQGEPNGVCVKFVGERWAVRVTEDGNVRQEFFNDKSTAERYAEYQRDRLKLPGKPPVADTQF
ncbi:hypothetical protein LB542_27860 [Mesorhizobium sp. BR1-1-9]|uniref:hypothetical protein n=1 Tax=unclassified Mesorhizobium TaxID=325217 RepID=UPI00112A16C9|nr:MULTISPECIES: hypothetical protein [unclassified Mesorhizobium]MBZ9811204.1 hypothetical protein [Mesorhizobium sp. ESP-6-2]MBZ9874655.1 hypothetical protein [Mesorhizobium sp. BR1-1-9]MBZ9942180.1 hypothetical protein [Mesorhizobium sp. BR1-1-13]TPM25783.1 hypothetical protein FJ955_22205 [Mesorhizobium sp. B2-2-2]